MKQKEFTLQRLSDAFDRLKQGKPINTPGDGKISIKRINDEAGLSQGAIYYYKSFVSTAKAEITILEADRKKRQLIDGMELGQTTEAKLRSDRDREKKLKTKYRSEANNLKQLSDVMVKENVSLAFHCMELQQELARATAMKITAIK